MKLLLISVLLSGSSYLYADDIEIINEFESNANLIHCSSDMYLSCLGIKKYECHDAIEVSNKNCITEIFLSALNGIIDESETLSVIKDESKKYSECLTQEWRNTLSLNENKYIECASHLEKVYEEYMLNVKKERELLENKFHEEL